MKPYTTCVAIALTMTMSFSAIRAGASQSTDAQPSGSDARLLNAEAWFRKGILAYHVHSNTEAAVHCFTNALARRDDYLPALLALGDIWATRGMGARARSYFMRAVQDERDAEYALRRLRSLYASKSNLLEEARLFQELRPTLTNNYIRSYITFLLGKRLTSLGNISKAESYYRQLAPLTNWMIVGGFDNAERTGLAKTFGPEKNLALDQTYDGKEWPVTWRRATPVLPSGALSLNLIRPRKWVAVYLRTGIVAPQATSAVVHISFAGAFRMWLNGAPVAEFDRYRSLRPMQYRVPVELHAGTNLCVLKLCAKNNDYHIMAWLAAPDNSPLKLESICARDDTVPLTCAATNNWPRPLDSPGTEFWKAFCATNDDPCGKTMLARYYRAARSYDRAIELYEELTGTNWLSAADLLLLGWCYAHKDSDSQAVAAFRSATARDPSAASAQTAIASHYADRGLYDLAQPLLEETLAAASNCLCARLRLIRVYDGRNWHEDAYRLAKETRDLFPDYAAAHGAFATTARRKGYDEYVERALLRALDCDFARLDDRYALARLYHRQRCFDDLFSQVDILEQLQPPSPGPRSLRLNGFMSLRDLTNSQRVCEAALSIFPDHSGFHKHLADILYMEGKRDEAIAAYRETLHYSPNYLWLRRYLDFLQERDRAFFETRGWPDERVRELVEACTDTEPSCEEEVSRVLLYQRLVQVYQDGSSRHMRHMVRRVLHPKGVRAASTVQLPGGSSGQLLRAVTHKRDGRILEATHVSSGQLEFPDVQVGDTIELKHLWDRHGGSWLDVHFYETFAFDYSQCRVMRAELAVALPTNRALRVVVSHEDMHSTTSTFESSFVTRWALTNIPMYRAEPSEPPYFDLSRRVTLSTITNWSEIAQWQQGMMSDVTRGDHSVAALAAGLVDGATSDLERIDRIFRFVTENVRYTQMYETDIAGVKPHPVPDILANRCGDCKDMSLLTAELLKAVGIPARMALVRTSPRGKIQRDAPTPDVFNHVLVFIPGHGEGGMFVDPTYRHGEFNLLPPPCQDVDALVISEDDYEFVGTPQSRPEDCRSRVAIKGVLRPDGGFTGELSFAMWRSEAASFRQGIENLPKISNLGSYLVALVDPGAAMLDFAMHNRKPGPEALKVEMAFSAPHLARKHGDDLAMPLPLRLKPEQVHGGLETRHHPLRLGSLEDGTHEYIFQLPEDYVVEIPVRDFFLENEFGSFCFTARVDNATLNVHRRLVLSKRDISVDEYPAFRDFLARCSHVTSQVLTFRREEGWLDWLF